MMAMTTLTDKSRSQITAFRPGDDEDDDGVAGTLTA
jgi:hypothetical protein